MRKRNIRNYCKLNIIDNRHEAISCRQTLVSHTLCIIMWTPPMAKLTQDIKPFCSYKLTQRYNRNTSTKLLKITERTDQLWDPSWELAYINIIFFYRFVLRICFFLFRVLALTGNTRQGTVSLREISCNLSTATPGAERSTWGMQPGTAGLQHSGNCWTCTGTVAALWNSPVTFSLWLSQG